MGSRTEFEAKIVIYSNELRVYCFRLTSSTWDAEDLCQEVLLRVFQYYLKIGMFAEPRALLYKVARNLVIDNHRKMRGSPLPLEKVQELPTIEMNYAAARGLVEWMTEHLSGRDMRMLLLAEVFRYSYRDIADELQCTVSAVKMALHRSKLTLRAEANPGCRAAVKRKKGKKTTGATEIDYWTHALMNHEPDPWVIPV
jgi:RNA polymerase sigma-70 factor (ECF subfamily)